MERSGARCSWCGSVTTGIQQTFVVRLLPLPHLLPGCPEPPPATASRGLPRDWSAASRYHIRPLCSVSRQVGCCRNMPPSLIPVPVSRCWLRIGVRICVTRVRFAGTNAFVCVNAFTEQYSTLFARSCKLFKSRINDMLCNCSLSSVGGYLPLAAFRLWPFSSSTSPPLPPVPLAVLAVWR